MEFSRFLRFAGFANSRLPYLLRSVLIKQKSNPLRSRPEVDNYFDTAMNPWLAELNRHYQYKAVITHFVIMSKALEAFPCHVTRIIDTQELFAIGLEANVAKGERLWINITPEEELKTWLPPEAIQVVRRIKNALGTGLPFRFLGVVPEQLPAYQNASLAICPSLSGTGLKSKIIEAFAFSKPIFTASFGRRGLEDADFNCQFVADKPKDFADSITRLMTDDDICRRMMCNALTYGRRWYESLRVPMSRCLGLKLDNAREIRFA